MPSLRSRLFAPAMVLALALSPAVAQPAPPSPSHIAVAKTVVASSGLTRSFDSLLPSFAEQVRQGAVTRPEITKDLNEVLTSLQPEMELQKQEMINAAARLFANRLTEAELKDIAAFFQSASGKRYVETQPLVLDDIVQEMENWTQRVSEYVMVRVRAEMGKRGHQMQ